MSDDLEHTAAIFTSSSADNNYDKFQKPFYEDTKGLEQWADNFKKWMTSLTDTLVDLPTLSEPFHYMRLLTSFGFDDNRFGLRHAYEEFARDIDKVGEYKS